MGRWLRGSREGFNGFDTGDARGDEVVELRFGEDGGHGGRSWLILIIRSERRRDVMSYINSIRNCELVKRLMATECMSKTLDSRHS